MLDAPEPPVSSRTLLRRAAIERATQFLQEELGNGPAAATKIEALAQQRGIGSEIDEAKETLGVTAERLDSGRGNVVHYALPA